MKVEVVRFDDDWAALVMEQNDWTGNYCHELRIIHGGYGEEWIKWNGYKVSVSKEVEAARRREDNYRSMVQELKELRKMVGR